MLVVHPSSSCDICLDPYSWDTPEQTPHAIACGHIFCRTCLGSVSPANCPLCRRQFDPTRVKKLHVDQYDDTTHQDKEIELLKRLVVEYKSRDDILVLVTTEVDDWLETQDENSCLPLRKAREAVASYQRAKQRQARDQRHIHQHLKHIENLQGVVRHETEAKAEITQRFQKELSELESKLSERDTEIARLKHELERYSLNTSTRANPLPAPPEPVSMDHLPSLYHALLGGTSSFSQNTQHDPRIPSPSSIHPLQTITNESGSSKGLYPAGFVPYHPPVNGENSGSISTTEHHHTPSRKDKGKGKERAPPKVSDFYAPSTPGPRERAKGSIIPGASPSNWVIPTSTTAPATGTFGYLEPSSSRPLDPALDGVDPYSLTSAYVMEYAQGYGEGYRAATGLTTPAPNPPASPAPALATQSDSVISSPNAYANHTVTQNGHSVLTTLPLYQPQGQAMAQFPLTRDTFSSDSLLGLTQSISELSLGALSAAPDSSAGSSHRSISDVAPTSSSIYSSHANSSHRRSERSATNGRTTAPIPTATHVAAPAPTRPPYVHAATDPAPVPQTARAQTSAGNRRESTASWGTIDGTQSNQGDDISRRDSLTSWGTVSRGTFSEFNLRTFNQGIPDTTDFSDYQEASRTPTASSSSLALSTASSVSSARRGQYPPTPSNQILAAPHGSQSTQVVAEPEPQQRRSRESRERRDGERSHRSSRHHRTRISLSAFNDPIVEDVIPPASAPVVPTSETNYIYNPPMSAGNALGLDLNLNTATPRATGIVAPTPRFSAQPLLRSFSSDRSS